MLNAGSPGLQSMWPFGRASHGKSSRLFPAGSARTTGSVRLQLCGLKSPTAVPSDRRERAASSRRREVVLLTQSKRSRTSQELSLTKTIPPAEPQRVFRSMLRHMRIHALLVSLRSEEHTSELQSPMYL